MQVNIFTQYYVPTNRHRAEEIDTCLKRNFGNPHIDRMFVFTELALAKKLPANGSKITVISHVGRATYRDWLENLSGFPKGQLSLFLNSDIYLNHTVRVFAQSLERSPAQKWFFAVSRYNPAENNGLALNSNPHWTQDVWGLVTPGAPFPSGLMQESAIQLGSPGCDNKIAFVFFSYGYVLTNPCLTLQAVHLQSDTARNYDARTSRVLGGYCFVHPADSPTSPSKLDFEIWSLSEREPAPLRINNWIKHKPSYELQFPKGYADSQNGEQAQSAFLGNADRRNDIADAVENPNREVEYIQVREFLSLRLPAFRRISARFSVHANDENWFFYDRLLPNVRKVERTTIEMRPGPEGDAALLLHQFLTPCIPLDPIVIKSRPIDNQDPLFWQFPCNTEGVTAISHQALERVGRVGVEVHCYCALPWATLIDKKAATQVLLKILGVRIKSYGAALRPLGLSLRVHTVCQHIFWKQLLDTWETIGITDAWLPHYTLSDGAMARSVRLHPWMLLAVNVENPNRADGLQYCKDPSAKRYLASFIGAHMDHYISDIRLRLKAFVNIERFCIEIKTKWHFNEIVYDHQVAGVPADTIRPNMEETVRYNQVLSESVFSLCPAGAGPNSLRFWESLAVGSVPVILSDTMVLPTLTREGEVVDWSSAAIRHPEADIAALPDRLRAIPMSTVREMQHAGVELYRLMKRETCFRPMAA